MGFYADFSDHYEKIFPFRPGVLAFLESELPADGRHLDLGCGTGHYCAALDKTGRVCLGADLDPQMIATAQANYPKTEFTVKGLADLADLAPGSFSGIYCIGNVLPHLPCEDLPGFLAQVHRILTPGGVWIFQTVNFDPLLATTDYRFPDLTFTDDDLVFERRYLDISEHSLRFATGLYRNGTPLFQGEVKLYPRTSTQYLELGRRAGFHLVKHQADFRGKVFDATNPSGSVFVWRRG